jgi:hypothetical protein
MLIPPGIAAITVQSPQQKYMPDNIHILLFY